MNIRKLTVPEVRADQQLLARLRELTIGEENDSAMLAILDEGDPSAEVFIAGLHPVGWAFLLRSKTLHTGVYVDLSLRRLGIGTALMRAVLVAAGGKTVSAYPRFDGAREFFESVRAPTIVLRTGEGDGPL